MPVQKEEMLKTISNFSLPSTIDPFEVVVNSYPSTQNMVENSYRSQAEKAKDVIIQMLKSIKPPYAKAQGF
jgi:hypothetical protein